MGRKHVISVDSVAGGWELACDETLAPMLFLSGAHAQTLARALARRLAAAGEEVQLTVRDGSHTLVASTRYKARVTA